MRRASPSGRDRPSHQAGPFLRKRLLPHQPFWPGKSEILKSAVEVGSLLGRAALRRMLGFGLLGVLPNGQVEVLVSPTAPMPRKNTHRRSRLVEEHRSRRGDPAEGGGSRTPIMTAYRQRALACAAALAQGLRRPRDLKASIPDAYNILHRNVYGWFVAIERGVYDLTETGRRALLRWPQMISPPDLHYPAIDASRPTTASRSTQSEPG